MNKIYPLFFLFLFLNSKISAQQIDETPLKTINEFVEGYNTQNYGKMRDVMSTVIKVLLTEKKVKLIYGTQFEMMVKAKIDKITKRSEQSYLINLKYERDTTEVQKLGFSISNKGKIIGISNPSLKILFPKTDEAQSFSEIIMKEKIDSIANLKYNAANFNGCILVLKDKNVFYQKCFGYSDIENKMLLNRDLSEAQITALQEYGADKEGIDVDIESVRFYPGGQLAAHVLGYTGEMNEKELAKRRPQGYRLGDVTGKMGLEYTLESRLRGEWGGTQVEVDGAGRLQQFLGQKVSKSGQDVTVTLDLELQKVAEAALGTNKAAIVAMDPQTGEILAMASRPAFAVLSVVPVVAGAGDGSGAVTGGVLTFGC